MALNCNWRTSAHPGPMLSQSTGLPGASKGNYQ
jgi:hypothetical protein